MIYFPQIFPQKKQKITSPIIFHFTGDVTHFYFQFPFSDNLYFPTDESGFSSRTLSGRESAHIYNECEKTHELHRQDDGDTQNEFGMPGLMTEGVHRNQSTDTSTECCHQHKLIFPDSPLALDGKILISPVHNECKEIYNQQVYDEDCEWAK